MLAINNLTIRFAGDALFSGISFMIRPKDRIGLTGKNGAGKTTLLKIINGEMEASEGEVSKPNDCKIAYLPQHISFEDKGISVLDEVKSAFSEIKVVELCLNQLNDTLVSRQDYESDAYRKIIQEIAELSEKLNLLGADSIAGKIEKTMRGLGFEKSDMTRNTAEFSGGWRMRIELAKLLLSQPEVLMLDEPTNHLDIESIQWLEDFLVNYSGAVLLISHDRQFLDTVTKRTLEIDSGKLYDYPVSYTKYEIMRQERMSMQTSALENQAKKIAETEKFVEKFRYKASKAKQVQSRMKQLEKLDAIDVDETDSSAIHFRFPPAPRSGTIVMETKKLCKSYGNLKVLENIDFILERGNKVAFVGRNGEGKTTLSKILLGQLDYNSGELIPGHNLSIGYYAQNQDEMLDNNKTVFQTLDDEARGEVRKELRNILGSFMFSGEDIDKKVSVLSGGERSRLALAKLLLEPHNLLVLDEPTNHLDIRSKDVLKKALQTYDGSLIIVSHDRYFLDGLTDTVYEFRNRNIRQHLGGVSAFLERRRIEEIQAIEHEKRSKQAVKKSEVSDNKLSYLAKKEQDKKIRKAQRKLDEIEAHIEALEKRQVELENLLANPENANPEIFTEYENLQTELSETMDAWDAAQTELDALNNN